MVIKSLSGAVVSENKLASEIGTRILEQGGNAVDAAIASVIAVNTTSPYHSDLGGGGFAIIRSPNGTFESLNFRSYAPDKATPEFYQNASTQHGGTAVAVPGQMRGLESLHGRYGRLPWKMLFKECISLSAEGQEMKGDLRHYIIEQLEGKTNREGSYMEDSGYDPFFDEQGEVIELGTIYKRSAYARTLELIANSGKDIFYEGEIVEGVVKAVQASGGLMTMDDLKNYRPKWEASISSTYRDYTLHTVPAPASGSIWLNTMGILDQFPVEGPGTITDMHQFTEALRLAYGTRTQLGDPDFVSGLDSAQQEWASKEYAKERAKLIDDEKTFPPDYHKPPTLDIMTDHGTSNITAADSDGLTVSITTTVGMSFGSRVITEHGFVLNDTMDDFSVDGRPNYTGYEPSIANFIAGRKRPISSSCPYIITDTSGRPILAGGAAGGSTIISANVTVARNVLDYGMTVAEAQRMTSLHNQVMPNVTRLERASTHQGITVEPLTDEQVKGLESKGHKIEWKDISQSTTTCLRFTYEGGAVDWEVAGEPRKHDSGGSIFHPEQS